MKIIGKDKLTEVRSGQWKISADYGILDSPEGKKLVMEPRLSKLMHLLAENAGSYVSRKYLIENMWPDTIVNEESLTRAVADLRKILANQFNNSNCIETAPKRGYRMVLNKEPRKLALKLRLNFRRKR